jgi:hypothetical protein
MAWIALAATLHSASLFSVTAAYVYDQRQPAITRARVILKAGYPLPQSWLVEQIDLGTAAGRPQWVDKNQKKLRAIQSIIRALEQQQVHGLPKGQREYGQSERARLEAERATRMGG